MPLTTTSGYTFPVAGVPTTQTPNQGSPAAAGAEAKTDYGDYASWNGDFMGYLTWLNKYGTDADHDRFMNYLMSEESSRIAREWTAQREDSQYQRLVEDMKKAGINPYALLTQGGSPVSSASSGHSYNGSYSSTESLKAESNAQKWASLITSIISTVVIAAVMMA